VITKVLEKDWEDVSAGGRAVPLAVGEEDCTECYKWDYENDAASKPPNKAGGQLL